MTLLAVERIKLFSTRSPWWCALLAVALPIGFTALFASFSGTDQAPPMQVAATAYSHQFGLMVVMVMAALAITTEYRFGTIKATFQAVPDRISPLVAKGVVVALLSAVIGLVVGFGAWALAWLIVDDRSRLALESANDWRHVLGISLVYAAGALLALGIGTLVRQTAGAVSIILVFALLVENLVVLIPRIGDDVQKWLPFTVAQKFVIGDSDSAAGEQGPPVPGELSPWGSLAYFAAIALAFFVISLVVAKRRDA